MQNTHNSADLGAALVELMGFLNSPQRDDALLREAGVSLDRALFPLLVALGARGAQGVGGLAALVGRDHTTVSRQLAKLESLGLIQRNESETDRRLNHADLTLPGRDVVQAITAARQRLLSKALEDWSEVDRDALAALTQRFAASLAGLKS